MAKSGLIERDEILRTIALHEKLLSSNGLDPQSFRGLHLPAIGCIVTEDKSYTDGFDAYGDMATFVSETLQCSTHKVSSTPSMPSLIP